MAKTHLCEIFGQEQTRCMLDDSLSAETTSIQKYMLWWFWNPINYTTTSTFEVNLWQYGPGYDTPRVLRLRDQSPGAPSGLNFSAPNIPKLMPFTFYTDQTVDDVQSSSYFRLFTTSGVTKTETIGGLPHVWANELAAEFYMHNWATGVGRYFNNYEAVIDPVNRFIHDVSTNTYNDECFSHTNFLHSTS